MKTMTKIALVETKLYFREPASWLIALLLPAVVLLVIGSIPSLRTEQPLFGGQRFVDVLLPSLLVITLATLGVNNLPLRLIAQRENGVLRRLSTTPAEPSALLVAQLIIHLALAIGETVLLMAAGAFIFAVPLPQNGVAFVLSFVLGLASVFTLGLMIAAVAPTARAGAALAMPLYFLVMFLGGAYLPRVFLPEFLQTISNYAPPGVQPLLDSWLGHAPDPAQLAVLAVISLVAGVVAIRSFRWE